MSRKASYKFWHRSRPVLGAAGGLFAAFTLDTNGVPGDAILHDSLTTLFETAPLVGYVLFFAVGLGTATAFRLFEDAYIYTD
jgi:hypothetical protein